YLSQAGIERTDQLDVLADYPPDHVVDVGDDRVEIYQSRFEHLFAAEGQKLPGQVGRASSRFPDFLDLFVKRLSFTQTRASELAVAYDRSEQIVEVVSDPSRQRADRFHLLRLIELFLQLFSLGDILNASLIADGRPAGISHRSSADRSTYPFSVLAKDLNLLSGHQAPPFNLVQ